MLELLSLNLFVALAILVLMLSLYFHAVYHDQPSVLLYRENPSTAASFWFYFGSMFCVVLTYADISSNGDKNGILSKAFFDTVGDFGSLCILASAWAYSRGKDFTLRSTLLSLAFVTLVLFLWYLAWKASASERSLLSILVEIAPGISLAVVSTVALGWVFFVRWGGIVGGFYFLLRIAYSVLQFPANLWLYIRVYLKDGGSTLEASFKFLAAGKVLLAIAFLSLLCRSDIEQIAIRIPKYVPNEPVQLPKDTQESLVRDFVIAVVMAGAVEALKYLFEHL